MLAGIQPPSCAAVNRGEEGENQGKKEIELVSDASWQLLGLPSEPPPSLPSLPSLRPSACLHRTNCTSSRCGPVPAVCSLYVVTSASAKAARRW